MHILHLNQRNQILFQYLRDKKKKKEGGSEKGGGGGGENSQISPPLDPRLSQSVITKQSLSCHEQEGTAPFDKKLIFSTEYI